MSFVLTPTYGQFYKIDNNTIGFRARFQKISSTVVCCNTNLQKGDVLNRVGWDNSRWSVPQGFFHELPIFSPFPSSSVLSDPIDLKIIEDGIVYDNSTPSVVSFSMITDVDADFTTMPPVITDIKRSNYQAQWINDDDGFASFSSTSLTAGRVNDMNLSLKFLTTESNVYAGSINFVKQGDEYIKTIESGTPDIKLYYWHMFLT